MGSMDHKLHAIDKYGVPLWEFPTMNEVLTTPAIDVNAKLIYVASLDNNLYAVDFRYVSCLTTIWTICTQLCRYLDCIIILIYKIFNSGQEQWRYTTGDQIYSSPVIGQNGTVYIASTDSYLYALIGPVF